MFSFGSATISILCNNFLTHFVACRGLFSISISCCSQLWEQMEIDAMENMSGGEEIEIPERKIDELRTGHRVGSVLFRFPLPHLTAL